MTERIWNAIKNETCVQDASLQYLGRTLEQVIEKRLALQLIQLTLNYTSAPESITSAGEVKPERAEQHRRQVRP